MTPLPRRPILEGMQSLLDTWLSWRPTAPRSAPRLSRGSETDARLRGEPVVWISTVRADGTPHLVPTWFSWDGEQLWVFSKPDAVKVRNLRRRPRAMLAVGDALDDFDVQLIEARGVVLDRPTAEVLSESHRRKYAAALAEVRIDWEEYAATYAQPIVFRPTRFLPWHGRGPRWEPDGAPPAPRADRPAVASPAWSLSPA